MSPIYLVGCPQSPRQWQRLCSFVRPDDARGAVARYGGRVRTKPGFCDIAPPPGVPVGLVVEPGRTGLRAYRPIVRFRAPSGRYAAYVEVTRFRGTCPRSLRAALSREDAVTVGGAELGRSAGSTVAFRRTVAPGRPLAVRERADTFPRPARRYCYRLVTRDVFGRDTRAATLVYDHRPVLPPIPPVVAVTLEPASGVLTAEFGGEVALNLTVAASDDSEVRTTAVTCGTGVAPEVRTTPRRQEFFSCTYRAGTYTVRVTATDDEGATTTVTRAITVLAAPVDPPPVDPPMDPPVDPLP